MNKAEPQPHKGWQGTPGRLGVALLAWILATAALAEHRTADISNTLHNLSNTGPGGVKAASGAGNDEICVYCHTPHGLDSQAVAPLWNREVKSGGYELYSSSSLDYRDRFYSSYSSGPGFSETFQPSGSSKLCLSCHDGTVALGAVSNAPGSGAGADIVVGDGSTTNEGKMKGDTSGNTRLIDTDLRNDHPISFTYDSGLAFRDGELVDPEKAPGSATLVTGSAGDHQMPLPGGELQCTTCHDPHIQQTGATVDDAKIPTKSIKFLRANRYQDEAGAMSNTENVNAGPGADFDGPDSEHNDIICLACHDKLGWAGSAHANPAVADERYSTDASDERGFPQGIRVWQAACLNCHDTHTASESRRLLRGGVSGDKPAIEETCYQCHTDPDTTVASPQTILRAPGTVVTPTGDPVQVPDIESDFTLLAYRMPVTTIDQDSDEDGSTGPDPQDREVHDISSSAVVEDFDNSVDCNVIGSGCGADFLESRTTLGAGGKLGNRHAECTDCHNPHRVTRNVLFTDNPATPGDEGTHRHNTGHTNLISGVLRGTWGVEPKWNATPTFYEVPDSFEVKRGDPGSSTESGVEQPYVTREYQVCLKCHSNYGYDDDDLTVDNWKCDGGTGGAGTRPKLVSNRGTTPPTGTDRTNFDCYTNQAREFYPGNSAGNTGASPEDTDNYRSWHPVMGPTDDGSGGAHRSSGQTGLWAAPWSGDLGTQTMYCTDCHGSDTGTTVEPATGENWGPHGSTNRFILKGSYDNCPSGDNPCGSEGAANNRDLCIKCHNPTSGGSNFAGSGATQTDHGEHNGLITGGLRCNACHVAVPHGWKYRSLLVNLNDVGPEAGLAPGTSIPNSQIPYTNGPYYRDASLKFNSLPAPGAWTENNCQGKDWMTNNCIGG